MAKKDIYKIDNYFITIGFILLTTGSIGLTLDPGLHYDVTIEKRVGDSVSTTYEDFNGRSLEEIRAEKGEGYQVFEKSFPLIRVIMFTNGVILLIIGYYYRSRENKIISIWNALEQAGEAQVRSLSISVGVSRDFILTHLMDINAQHQGSFSYDSRNDKIVNNRLLTEFLVMADCANCGNKINQKVSLDLSNPPRCQYCGTGVSTDYLNQLKQEVLSSMQVQQAATQTGKEFSIPVFVLLLIFFWPGAIFYVVKKRM